MQRFRQCERSSTIAIKPTRPPGKIVTARDLARLLGVSQSMISRAFDPVGRVSAEKRTLIVEAAARLGYRPNAIARSLTTRRSGIVAIVIGGLENPFYTEMLGELMAALDRSGFRALLFQVPPGEDVDDQLPALRQYNVDALVVASATISSRIADEWQREGRRVVLINRTITGSRVPSVSCDNRDGARRIADLFAESGHVRPVYIAGPHDTSTNREREAHFISRLMEHGLPLAGRVDAGEYSYRAGFTAMREAVAVRPDAIFFANDILAIGGMDCLRHEFGLRIPQDVSVAGFDGIALSGYASYALTTVRQPVAEMVKRTIALLTGSDENAGGTMPGELLVRASIATRASVKVFHHSQYR